MLKGWLVITIKFDSSKLSGPLHLQIIIFLSQFSSIVKNFCCQEWQSILIFRIGIEAEAPNYKNKCWNKLIFHNKYSPIYKILQYVTISNKKILMFLANNTLNLRSVIQKTSIIIVQQNVFGVNNWLKFSFVNFFSSCLFWSPISGFSQLPTSAIMWRSVRIRG